MEELSLYERLGGVFAIAAVVDHFSDALIENPMVGKGSQNPQLREWSNERPERLPGLSGCGRYGSARSLEVRSSTSVRDPAGT